MTQAFDSVFSDNDGEETATHSLLFVESLYAQWLEDPHSVSPQWQAFFKSVDGAPVSSPERGAVSSERRAAVDRVLYRRQQEAAELGPEVAETGETSLEAGDQVLQENVDQLIRNYRVRGHMIAQLDPLNRARPRIPELEPEYYGFTEADFDKAFSTKSVYGQPVRTLRELIAHLQKTYCSSIGVQYMHIDDLSVRQWLQERMEGSGNRTELSLRWKYRILSCLSEAIVFEEFIQKKYIGAKSFSLEGTETLLPMLDLAVEHTARNSRHSGESVDEIVIGMTHRGRLNVLANLLDKNPRQIFREFEDVDPELNLGRGDVKYHLGYSTDRKTTNGRTMHLSLCFNPSHLEFVNPVALGRTRAKQDRCSDTARRRCMTLLIHGDAAFAGEGMVQESLNLSELPDYHTGGTLHVIVNNQLGFTTTPEEGRSTAYCTDVARMLQSPVFHVNGEHPEAVAHVVQLAIDFRETFQRDVFIDLYCYRMRGHNEGDEPAFTQPQMYDIIGNRPSVLESYRDHLLELGGISEEAADQIFEDHREWLEEELSVARDEEFVPESLTQAGVWAGYRGGDYTEADVVETGVETEQLSELLAALADYPEDFHAHKKIERGLQQRRNMADGERPLDWSAAEALALAALAVEGTRIRMSGQDTARGTFSQRHARLHDVENGRTRVPLQHLSEDQAEVQIINSPLSEAGVLGFEYGYSLDSPDVLVLWEAQFGDFVNAAQVIIDQFLASAEDKWKRLSGLVLLLPHGFEGQGPEHSSARLERFLMLAAEDNIQVVQPTTPAQYFHVLRRQAIRRWRKPLIVLTPKSLLRHKACTSSLEDCSDGHFQSVIPDGSVDTASAHRVLICSGKVYYHLVEERERLEREDVAIVRLEQLYPFPEDHLRSALAGFADGTPAFWVQDEPENQGAWWFIQTQFQQCGLDRLPLKPVARAASASPATGSKASHKYEQKQLLGQAFSST